jgi:glycosyltransferase involved in cell wall biosynthesis
MRILHVYKNYVPPIRGGIETHVRQLATGLVRRGAQVIVLVVGASRKTIVEECEGVRVIRAARLGEVASTPISLDLFGQLGRIDTDLIHVHLPYPPGELAALIGGRECPIVATYHSDVVRQWWALSLYRPLARALLRRASVVIATSPAYIETSPILRPLAERCQVVPLGVDPDRFRPDAGRRTEARRKWLGDRDLPLVLFVGKFRSYKGLPYLIDAAPLVNARFLLVGSGPLALELRAHVERLGLVGKVIFAGEVDDDTLPDLYRASNVVVLPSTQRSEAFGMVLLEGMSSGCPVVSTELGTGTSWVNQHERTGLVVPPADPSALAGALNRLIEDPVLAECHGKAGRERVEAEFTEGRMVERVAGIYDEALAGLLPLGNSW